MSANSKGPGPQVVWPAGWSLLAVVWCPASISSQTRCSWLTDLIITGEGYLDEQSFEGKVVGGMAAMGARFGTRVVAIAGDIAPEVVGHMEAISLVDRFGDEAARGQTLECIRTVVRELLSRPAG
jgi:Glycerate kinase family